MRTTLGIALILTLTLAACGGDADPYDALRSGDYTAAIAGFDTALEGKQASDEKYVELQIDRCLALAHVDADRAESSFKALLEAVTDPGRLTPSEFSLVATELLAAKAGENAVQVVDAGMKRFPENPKMKALLAKVIEAAKDDPAASNALKGLGYIGGD